MESITGHRATSLPLDILPSIIQHISKCSDLLNLCIVSRSFAYYTRNRLYDGSLFLSATLDYPAHLRDPVESRRRVGTNNG